VDANPAALNVKTDGDVALDVLNFDSNPQVKALVPACPQLYTITATSIARQTVEANMRYVPGLAFNLSQGQYRATLVPQVATAASWTGTITVVPGATLTRPLNVMGLDSSGTSLFNLTVTNGFTTTDVEVFEFDSRLSGMLPGQTAPSSSSVILRAGETRIYTPHGCAQIYIRKLGQPAVVDQFVMPYGAFTSQQGMQAATLLITNRVGHDHHDHGEGTLHHHQPDSRHHGHLRLFIYRNDVLLGTVNHHHKDMKFTDLLAGDKITIFDWDGNLLATLTLVVGTNSVTVGG
jgi:hypothetical protein